MGEKGAGDKTRGLGDVKEQIKREQGRKQAGGGVVVMRIRP